MLYRGMRQLFFISAMILFLTPFSAMAEERENMYDYYYRILEEKRAGDGNQKSVRDYYDNGNQYDNPFDVPKEKKEDRMKRYKPMKQRELDNGISSQKRSSQQVLDWMMSTR